jgi:hypothetical protein
LRGNKNSVVRIALLGFQKSDDTAITKAGAHYFGLPDRRIFAERGWHMVVRCQGKMYDALTGPRGMSWEEYKEFLAKLKIIAIPIRMPD